MARPLDDQPDRVIARRARAASGEVVDRGRRERPEPDEGPSDADLERFGDVTVKCRHCGATLHDDVQVCWKCGMALGAAGESRGSGWWVVAVVVLCALALVLATIL